MGLAFVDRREHFYRAFPPASAYALRGITFLMLRMGSPLEEIHAVGDGAQSGLWRQIVADVTGLPVSITEAVGLATHIKETHERHPNPSALYDEIYQISRRTKFSLLPVLEHVAKINS